MALGILFRRHQNPKIPAARGSDETIVFPNSWQITVLPSKTAF
jgi:hypothetical protein